MVCSPEAGNILANILLLPDGKQIVMLPSHNSNNCFIMLINIFSM